MNIVVRTYAGKYVVRPDTTWEKDSEDFFPPEFVDRLSLAPVLVARVLKPGRSVGERFAERYYDYVGYGVLLYPDSLLDGSEEGFACASCLDHTSFIPAPSMNVSEAAQRGVRVVKNGAETVFESSPMGEELKGLIARTISEATRYIYIRTGDLIAVELGPRCPVASKEEGTVEIGCDGASFRVVY